jgi:hypothetical protein
VDDDLVAKEQKAKDAEGGRPVEKQIDLRHICLLIFLILTPTLRHDDYGAKFIVGIDEGSFRRNLRGDNRSEAYRQSVLLGRQD